MSRLRVTLAALSWVALVAPVAAQAPPGRGYGPSWLGPGGTHEPIYVFGAKRPAALKADVYTTELRRNGAGLAVTVVMWADVADLKKGTTYQLRYQLQLHTKKGVAGPLLGTAAVPGGIGPVVHAATAGDNWNGLEGEFDVTRKELSGMTNLPDVKSGRQTVFVRVQPQIFNVTAGKYVTPPTTDGVILVLEVGPNRAVESVGPLPAWVVETGARDPQAVVTVLNDLDGYRVESSRVGLALGVLLNDPKVPKDAKLKLIAWAPPVICEKEISATLYTALNELSGGTDPELKAAAGAKMNAMFESFIQRSAAKLEGKPKP